MRCWVSLAYSTMGSGSLNAMAVFNSSYDKNLPQDKAVYLVTRAIRYSGRWSSVQGSTVLQDSQWLIAS